MTATARATPAALVRVPAGTSAGAAVRQAGRAGSGPETVVVVRDSSGVLKDLAWVPDTDAEVEPIAAATPDGRNVIRHSTAHVLAQAVQQEFPGARLGIGPYITDGFYYDFQVDRPFTPEDLARLETRMKKIIKAAQRFSRRVVEVEQARAELSAEPFKLELVADKSGIDDAAGDDPAGIEVGGSELTVYDNLDPRTGAAVWSDLCRGPHVPTTKYIPAFTLTRSSAAYWRGDQSREDLQRIYGTAWESREALAAHLTLLAEAEKRDHRKLGQELDLFSFPDELGSGLPIFHPKGGIVRKELEDYARSRHVAGGYQFVNTPHVTKAQLFETSRHLEWYADGMFPPMHLDAEYHPDGSVRKPGQDYYVKPMNCPMHNLIYRSRGRSYRELPLRLFEFGSVYRYEKSGVVHGLTRVRGMTQDDSHIYCAREQVGEELATILRFVLDLLADYGLYDYYLELSTKDPDKHIGGEDIWEEATETLRSVAEASGLELVADPGGAAFYGPKISVQTRDALGRNWQMSTLQLDFFEPELFDLQYTAADGSKQRPVMIHRALFGSIERFFGVLTEHYAGAFPAWLAPVQAVGIPVADAFAAHLDDVIAQLRAQGVRAEVDHGDDRMQKKIFHHTAQKVPFLLIAGAQDTDAGAVSFRFRDGTQRNGVPVADAVAAIVDWIARRDNSSPTAESFQKGV